MIVSIRQEDILDHKEGIIIHGVNCQNVMGSGVAKVLYEKYPIIKESYHNFCKTRLNLLGKINPVYVTDNLIVINAFTQIYYGKDFSRYVNYAAIVNVFKEVINLFQYEDILKKVAIPKIGCGLAGGDWTFMQHLIEDTVEDKMDITVYLGSIK